MRSIAGWPDPTGTINRTSVTPIDDDELIAGRARNALGARGRAGTAYRIRTGDLRLERAVSWASRRMRRRAHDRPTARTAMIPIGARSTPALGTGCLEAVRLQEAAGRVRDLLVALLPGDQAGGRGRAQWLVLGAEPFGDPLRGRLRNHPVQPCPDHEARQVRERPRVD